MGGFTKLFSSIVTSTIWCEDHATVRVWIAMLATCDADGAVEGSVPGFASLARVTVPEMEAAILKLESPDPHSRTPDNEGRRIQVIDGGWVILNHWKYRGLRDGEERKKQVREAVARHRAKRNQGNQPVINVSPGKPMQKTDTDTDNSMKKTCPAGAGRAPVSVEFASFWGIYPRKVGKGAALAAWRKIKAEEVPAILAAADEQKTWSTFSDPKYIPHPATWLNGRRWEDEKPPDRPATQELFKKPTATAAPSEWTPDKGGQREF